MSVYSDKLARILRVDKAIFAELEENLGSKTGKLDVMERIVEKNEFIIEQILDQLGHDRKSYAKDIYRSLISKLRGDDVKIFNYLGLKGVLGEDAARKICEFTVKVTPPQKGFFLKKEKAREFLLNTPPLKIIDSLGYKNAEELLAKEDLLEVFSALRFLEDGKWLNEVFFKQYEALTPDDFEERAIEVRALGQKWAHAAERFVAKKYHNVSHLKELGVIFVIPIFMDMAGETMRIISLLMHYLNEVKYYSDLFEMFKARQNFSVNLISLLRGDVAEDRRLMNASDIHGSRVLVVQRYLAKGDENDWRLFVPHVNPEAIHWAKAEDGIADISNKVPEVQDDFDFWRGLGWVGDYFDTDSGIEVLVSFNLVDTVMSLVKEEEIVKYLYHQQEALWNRILIEYFGEEKVLQFTRENIVKGWFEV